MDQAIAAEYLTNDDRTSSVRHIECDDLNLFSTIDEATRTWLNNLHYVWDLWKKSRGVTKTLTDYFETAPNPYLSTLRLLVNTNDFMQTKTKSSLSFAVMEEFSRWISLNKEFYRDYLTENLKLAAFQLVSRQKNMKLMKLVAETYELICCNELFHIIIKDFIQQKKFKEAAQYAEILNLQPFFADPETLQLPLILQNKMTVVEHFMANYPDIQKNLIQYLDNLLAPGKKVQVILDQFIMKNRIPDVKMSIIQLRPISKLISRLTKMYQLPPEICPNLNHRRGEGALQFLIYKRFIEGSLSSESWREMVKEAVGDDIRLHIQLVRSLSKTNVKEALYFAKTLNVPQNEWPRSVLQSDRGGQCDEGAGGTVEENRVMDDIVNFHTFNLPRECIQLVDNRKSFERFLDELMKGIDVVGIDSEWKPFFGTKKSELALIQIATRTRVYILDTMTLGIHLKDLWSELELLLFENKNVLKLGFGLSHDIEMMRDNLPILSNVKMCGSDYMDLLHVWRKLIHDYNFEFPHSYDPCSSGESLSKLVELSLGKQLNKSDQFSNWERRPLRESQIIYAALDAYCLLEVYESISKQCAKMNIPFQEVSVQVQHISFKSLNKSDKKAATSRNDVIGSQSVYTRVDVPQIRRVRTGIPQMHAIPQETVGVIRTQQIQEARCELIRVEQIRDANSVHNFSVPAHEWRVVCDSILGGLSKKLRMCGCNCIHIEYDRGGDLSIQVALRENRVLLTRNSCYQRFNQYLPSGFCYRVLSDRPENQLLEVLNHFDILVTEKDIFSRCQVCNKDEFVRVPNSTMNMLVNRELQKIAASVAQCEPEHRRSKSISQNKDDRTWQLSTDTLNVLQCRTRYGIPVKIDKIPPNVLKNVDRFYICERCGKVYWNGSHMERALSGVLKGIISHQ